MRVILGFGPMDVRVVERPEPVPGEGQVLVAVRACGICGSDKGYWLRGPSDHVPGHEAAGEIVGPGPRRLPPADRRPGGGPQRHRLRPLPRLPVRQLLRLPAGGRTWIPWATATASSWSRRSATASSSTIGSLRRRVPDPRPLGHPLRRAQPRRGGRRRRRPGLRLRAHRPGRRGAGQRARRVRHRRRPPGVPASGRAARGRRRGAFPRWRRRECRARADRGNWRAGRGGMFGPRTGVPVRPRRASLRRHVRLRGRARAGGAAAERPAHPQPPRSSRDRGTPPSPKAGPFSA